MSMTFSSPASILTCWVRIVAGLLLAGSASPLLAQYAKIDLELARRMDAAPDALQPVVIVLADQIDTRALLIAFESQQLPLEERSYRVITQLQAKATATQPPVIERLRNLPGVEANRIYPLWIINALYAEANAAALQRIASWPEIKEIFWNAPVEIMLPASRQLALATPNGKEPGLAAIKAPFMWNLGYTGYGRKALVIDTGNDGEHPALRDNYWGHIVPKAQAWNGSRYPEDCAEHGTHVTGIVCGLDRQTNDTIGVAFNAHWMGGPMQFPVGSSLGCSSSFNQTIFSNVATMQWALNPDGNPATTADQPDAVNCSWRASPFFCGSFEAINILNALEAAGIGVVWAAGNEGPNSGTVDSGAALNMDLVNTFAVGAVHGSLPNFPIADFSSRGPSPCGGVGPLLIKPEVVAPGVAVRSAIPGGSYQSLNGTSMAAPHAAGALLLLREAFPYLSGIQLKLALYFSAIDLGVPGEDNTYGRGMIDLEAAYQYLLQQGHTPVPPTPWTQDAVVVNVQVNGKCRGAVTASVTFENAGQEAIQSLEIRYGIEGGPLQSYLWEGNLLTDGIATVSLPPFDGVTPGEHTFIVELHAPNGKPDNRPLNNRFKRVFEIADEDYPSGEALLAQPVCSGARVLLQYNATLAPQERAIWFNSPSIAVPSDSGQYFLTPPLTQNTTYYVGKTAYYKVGRPDLSAGVNSANSLDGGLIFNASKPFILRSVKIFADQTGVRSVRLLDRDGNIMISRPIIVTQTGEQRVTLNLSVPKGERMALVLSGNFQLRHSFGGTGFPYQVPDVVSIVSGRTSSGASTTLFYYYFFDWEIEVPSVCGRVAVPIEIQPTPAPVVSFTASADTVFLPGPGTVTFTDQTPNAISWQWIFGNGQQGTNAQEIATYVREGTYRVKLIVTTSDGCSNAAEKTIVVLKSVSTRNALSLKGALSLFPNPTSERLNVVLGGYEALDNVEVTIVNTLGQVVLVERGAISGPSSGNWVLDVSALPSGHYAVLVQVGGQHWASGVFARR